MPPKKLNKDDYNTLMSAYDDVMNADPASSKIGLHAILIGVLNRLGFRIRSIEQAIAMAQELLDQGYEHDET